jgi:O-antigen/teichoic acid export membrane protein
MFVARCLALTGPLVVAVITARMLGPEDRGRYYYVITLATMGAQLASLGIHSSNTFMVARQPDLLPRILANTAWVGIVVGVVAALGAVMLDFALGDAMHLGTAVLFVFALCPLTLLFLYLSNLAVAVNRPRLFNGVLIFNGLALLATTVACGSMRPALNSFLAAVVASALISCLVAWALVGRGVQVPWTFDRRLFSRGIAFALRAYVLALAGFLMTRTSVVIIRHTNAFADLGHWSISAQIVEALLLLPATTSLLLFPTLVRADRRERWTEFMFMMKWVSAAMLLVCGLAGLLARPVIRLLFGDAYEPAVGITLALLPGVFFLSVSSVVSQLLTAVGIPRSQLMAWLVGLAVQIALSVALVGTYGVLGLAWTQSACAGFVCVWLLVSAARYSPRGKVSRLATSEQPIEDLR